MSWAFIYPGQGSQSVGMGKFLSENFKIAKEVFEEASDSLGFNIAKLCFEGPESDLSLTQNTQPAILTVSVASTRVATEHLGLKAKTSSGHSIGEYAAVVAGQVMTFAEAVKAVRIRGEAMQEAVPVGHGGMLAVMGLDSQQVLELCQRTEELSGFKPVEPANFNAPGQIVISGSQKALNWLKDNFKPEMISGEAKRVKLIPLQVSAPFHCSLMKPAEEKMRLVLNATNFNESQFPIVQNYTAKIHSSPNEIRENLIKQVSGSVRWIECVEQLGQLGIDGAIELGSGKVLAGLVKKINPNLSVYSFNSLEDIKLLESTLAGGAKQ